MGDSGRLETVGGRVPNHRVTILTNVCRALGVETRPAVYPDVETRPGRPEFEEDADGTDDRG